MHTDKVVLCDYIKRLKKTSDVSSLSLMQPKFIYNGSIANNFSMKTFLSAYVDPIYQNEINDYHKTTKRKTCTDISTYNEDEAMDYFDEIDKDFYLQREIGNGKFIWVTSSKDFTIKSLGLEKTPNTHMISIHFPHKEYTLYYPTAIEGYGVDWNYRLWFYANIEKNEEWGCSVNIKSLKPQCTEQVFRGSKEALMECEKLTKEHLVDYLGKETEAEQYFEDKYEIFLDAIKREYDTYDPVSYILSECFKGGNNDK